MISSAEAEACLVNILKFKNWKDVLERDKLEFLRVLTHHYAHNLYFQNISMTSTPPEKRRVPAATDIVSAGLTGTGGACITQNSFLCILLKALGFNSYVISGYVHGPQNLPDNHVMCVVEFSPEEKYLMDVGVGLPFAEPVPMHKLPYTQVAAGFRYRYKEAEEGNGVYYRVQLDGALFGGEFEDKSTEYIRYEFTIKPVSIQFFEEPLTIVFKNVDNSIFLQHPFMFRYFEEDAEGNLLEEANVDGDRKWILIRGVSVLIGTDKEREVKHYSSYDEVQQVIFKYFPKFPKENLERAIEYFNETVPKYGYFKAN